MQSIADNTHPLEAVLFDLDGTIADTEASWIAAKAAVAARHGIAWSREDGLISVGQPTHVYAEEFIARGAGATAQQIAEEISLRVVDDLRTGIRWRPGALELLGDATACSSGLELKPR